MRVVSRTSHLKMKSCGRFEQGVLNLDPIYIPGEDRHNLSQSYLRARLVVMLGGRTAEEIVFGEMDLLHGFTVHVNHE